MFITFIAPVQASQDARGGEPMLAHVVLTASHNSQGTSKIFFTVGSFVSVSLVSRKPVIMFWILKSMIPLDIF